MKIITDLLIEKSGGLLKLQPEINDWTKKSYMMFNTGSVELEVAEFLYGLVRMIKPQQILETGTHFGISALYMALACQENGFGTVTSLEYDSIYLEDAQKLWRNCGVDGHVVGLNTSSLKYKPNTQFDVALLDTEPGVRFEELLRYYPYLNPGGFLFVHDLHRHMSQESNPTFFGWPFGKLPDEIVQWVQDGDLRPFHFPTPRGFTGFYKSREDDYKWK